MQIKDKPWQEIVPAFSEELRRCQYSVSVISALNAKIIELETFGLSQGVLNYSIEIGQEFLSTFYPISGKFKTWKDVDSQTRQAYWAVGLLNDLFLNGCFSTTIKMRNLPLTEEDELLLLNFYKYQLEHGYAEKTAKRCMQAIRPLITYLDSHHVLIKDIGEKEVIGFLAAYMDKSKCYINTIIVALNRFSRYLFDKGIVNTKISEFIPPLNKMISPRVPSVWEENEVEKLLESVDRGSPLGKRDYAILLLAAKRGLRCSDIKRLMFSNIDWDRKVINITQHKTQKNLSVPFSTEIGWAIIDYVKNARPKSELPYVFLVHTAPIKPFAMSTSLYGMISRYRTIAGIDLHDNARRGMHSLRHTFATNMLRNGIPLETIAEMLGHVGMSSVDVYLNVETEQLRSISLDPEEVFHDKQYE